MKSIFYITVFMLFVSQGVYAKAILGEVIVLNEEQLANLRLHIRKNVSGLASNVEFKEIKVKSYFKGRKQHAFISLKPFESSLEYSRENEVNCSRELNADWYCNKTLITKLFIDESMRAITLMKGNSIAEAREFIKRFLNSKAVIIKDDEGNAKLEYWKETLVVTQDITWVKLENKGIREVGLLGGLALKIRENDNGDFHFLSMHSFAL